MVPWHLLLLLYIATALQHLLLLPKCSTGLMRMMVALPLLLCAVALPFPLDKATARGSLAFVVSWLTVFKAFAAAMGRGPLGSCAHSHRALQHRLTDGAGSTSRGNTCSSSSSRGDGGSSNRDREGLRQLTLVQQAALLLLPLTEQHKGAQQEQQQHQLQQQQDGGQHGVLSEVTFKLASGFAVIVLLHTVQLPTAVRHLLYAVVVWLAVSVLLDFPSALLGRFLGLQLSPAMDSPLASTGLADFWGRRYNRAVSAVLRFTVYEPLLQLLDSSSSGGSNNSASGSSERVNGEQRHSDDCGSGGGRDSNGSCGSDGRSGSGQCAAQRAYKPAKSQPGYSQLAKAVATAAAFGVSGLMHELCTWHMCQTSYVTQGHFMPGRHTLFFLLQAPLVLLEKHFTFKKSSSSSNAGGKISKSSRQEAGLGKVDSTWPPVVNLVASSCTLQQHTSVSTWLHCDNGLLGGFSRVPKFAARVLRSCCTFAVVLLLAEFLFWPPLESCAADVNGIAELSDMLSSALRASFVSSK